MVALSPAEFEMELRSLCDAMYERESAKDNPMLELMQGTLSLADAHRFWGGHWESVLIFNQITLPRLLERCPDIDSRVQMWNAIYPEYGRGYLVRAHPYLNRTFLLALGIPPEACPLELDREKPSVAQRIAAIDAMDWIDLLVYGFLGPETVGPKVFDLVAKALKAQFGLSDDHLLFFTVHSREDQRDSEILFPLVARYATTAEAQDKARAAIAAFYNLERYRSYGCALGPIEYSFAKAAGREGTPSRGAFGPRSRPFGRDN